MKRKTAFYVDHALLRAAKIRAAETGRKEYEIVDAALRQYLEPDGTPTLEALRRRRDELLDIGQRHGASNVRVFGSVARGQARPGSDIDFLVELEPGRSLVDLEEALGREVDAVEMMSPSQAAVRIAGEAVPL